MIASLWLALVFGLSSMFSPGREVQTTVQQPIVVMARLKQGQVKYEIESKPVGSEPLALVNAFGRLIAERGREATVLIFAEGSVPNDRFSVLADIAGKSGFTKFRYFVFGDKTKYMSEVTFGKSVAFSTDPPPQ
jgi:hypothetical protein